jgi:hypothetical protein
MTCPLCGSYLEVKDDMPRLSQREKNIFNSVINSPDGIETKSLIKAMSEPKDPSRRADIVLRVRINGLNEKLRNHNLVIRGHRGEGRYRILPLNES